MDLHGLELMGRDMHPRNIIYIVLVSCFNHLLLQFDFPARASLCKCKCVEFGIDYYICRLEFGTDRFSSTPPVQ